MMKTDEELKTLARRAVNNEIMVTNKAEVIETSFSMILATGWQIPKKVSALWGSYEDTFPRSINGLPLFHTAGWLTEEEYPIFLEHLKRMDAVLKS